MFFINRFLIVGGFFDDDMIDLYFVYLVFIVVVFIFIVFVIVYFFMICIKRGLYVICLFKINVNV